MSLNWHGDEVMEQIRQLAHRAIANVAVKLFDQIVVSISIQGPPRSDPGEPPHIDTRQLLESWILEYSEDVLAYRLSSDVVYSIYLELGTINLAARPSVMPAILEIQSKAVSLLKDGMTRIPPSSGYNYQYVTF